MKDGTGNATMTCFTPHTDGLIKDINILLEEVLDKDPEIIPEQISALENTRHVFQFRFAKPIGKAPPTFVLEKVMDNIPTFLPALAEGSSSPLITSTTDQTATEFSPPPATPPPSQQTPVDTPHTTHHAGSSSIRKALFSASTEHESSPEPKKHKAE